MKDLAQLQTRFQQHIVHDDQTVTAEIAGPDDQYRQTRLAIYYNAYRLRLVAALAVDYPVLETFLGDAGFEEVAIAYIDTCPSTFRNLRWFGKAMPQFLGTDPRFSTNPFLAKLAEFEWAQGLAFDSADAPQPGFEQLASVPPDDWPGLRFVPHTSLHLVESHWNVIPMWHAHRDEEPLPVPVSAERAATIAVWRRDYKSYFRTLDRDEAWLWRTLTGGTVFGEACSSFAVETDTDDEGAAMRAATLLRSWVEDGWIQGFDTKTPS